MITFKYREEPLGKKSGSILRPVADVFLKSKSGVWIEYHPYIDSGADVSLIPLSLGKLLGFHLNESRVEQIGGIRGNVPIVSVQVPMKIGSDEFIADAAWALVENIPPLLGRTTVFDIYKVTFEQSRQQILFQPLK